MNTAKLIESVHVFTQDDVRRSGHKTEWIAKEDFDRVVEELTKWNKVEEGVLPESDKEILFKRYDGVVYLGKYCEVFKMEFVANCVTIKNVTEWRYIY